MESLMNFNGGCGRMSSIGTIVCFAGSHLSGLGFLFVEVEEGIQPVMCDNPTTVTALDDCFGNVIQWMHINNNAIKGKRIEFETNWTGVLEWFMPIEAESQC